MRFRSIIGKEIKAAQQEVGLLRALPQPKQWRCNGYDNPYLSRKPNRAQAIQDTLVMCAAKLKRSTEDFIREARQVHGDKFDYTQAVYIGAREKLTVICPEHGEFRVVAFSHLQGHDCFKCANKTRSRVNRKSLDEFVRQAREVHGEHYDYSKVDYKNWATKVIITCSLHGDFLQGPNDHIQGNGCPECGKERASTVRTKTRRLFIEQARKVHSNRYDYQNVVYKGNMTAVEIICLVHGSFSQAPGRHLRGQGCPRCKESEGERLVSNTLEVLNIHFSREVRFEGCRDRAHPLPFDFAFSLAGQSFLVEYDGPQHKKPIGVFGGEKAFLALQRRDRIKTEFAHRKGFCLIRIPHTVSDVSNFLIREICQYTELTYAQLIERTESIQSIRKEDVYKPVLGIQLPLEMNG